MCENCRTKEILKAVVANDGAPSDVLLRLLAGEASEVWSFLAWRALPGEVIDAIIAHPEQRLRRAFAENINVDANHRARLVDDPERGVRLALAMGPNWFRVEEPPLPEWAQRKLLSDPDAQVRQAAAECYLTDDHIVAEFADDASPAMRRAVCQRWSKLAPEVQEVLLADPDPGVRMEAAIQASRTRQDCADLVVNSDIDSFMRSGVIRKAVLSREAAQRLATGVESDRIAVAGNSSVPVDIARGLAVDESHAVRLAAACHPGLTEAERADIDYEVKPNDRLEPVPWVLQSADPEALRACARSAHTLLRRSAAYNKNLPPDVVELLAGDDDYIVRLLLCENQPTVAADVVLQTYLDCPFISKSELLKHPNFPRTGHAARFGDPDPRRRYLATLDPAIDASALITLAGDTDRHVRHAAVSHPGLPREVLLDCLERDETRLAALRNPSLPHELLHQTLDGAGIPDLTRHERRVISLPAAE